MTIGDYIGKLQAVNASELAAAAMDENADTITAHTRAAWDEGENPDGNRLSAATWNGSDVSQEYREKWKVSSRIYHYRSIDISGDTRRGMQVRGGRIFSISEYWDKILQRFRAAGFSPVSFAGVSTTNLAKRLVSTSFFRLLRAKITQK